MDVSTQGSATEDATVQFFTEAGEVRDWRSLERDIIKYALAYHDGNISKAARDLRVGRTTIYNRLARK